MNRQHLVYGMPEKGDTLKLKNEVFEVVEVNNLALTLNTKNLSGEPYFVMFEFVILPLPEIFETVRSADGEYYTVIDVDVHSRKIKVKDPLKYSPWVDARLFNRTEWYTRTPVPTFAINNNVLAGETFMKLAAKYQIIDFSLNGVSIDDTNLNSKGFKITILIHHQKITLSFSYHGVLQNVSLRSLEVNAQTLGLLANLHNEFKG